ncbi:hypothetical protein PQR05_29310 [Paraburkholderia sediminicola]|uniref:hypothetical protein n=1 Tax=Paraburkholderia sediminicola TaxID=458836 RepID=UPI0038BCADAE
MSLRTPLELGLGAYMGGFHASIEPDTQSMVEFAARDLARAIAWVPGRMIDDVQAIITEWRKNDNTGAPGLSSMLPAVFVGLAKDFSPVLPEFGIAAPSMAFAFPDDELQRMYRVSTVCNEYRGQVVFVAPEGVTAHSLMLQFNRWTTQGPTGRRFSCAHTWNGFTTKWPAVLETIDYGGVNVSVEQSNLTVLVADLTVRATVPIFTAPREGQPNDGKTAPAGYPVVVEIDSLGTFRGAAGPAKGASIKTTVDDDGNIVQVRT